MAAAKEMFVNHKKKPNQNLTQCNYISKVIKQVHGMYFISQRSHIKPTVVKMWATSHIPPFSLWLVEIKRFVFSEKWEFLEHFVVVLWHICICQQWILICIKVAQIFPQTKNKISVKTIQLQSVLRKHEKQSKTLSWW